MPRKWLYLSRLYGKHIHVYLCCTRVSGKAVFSFLWSPTNFSCSFSSVNSIIVHSHRTTWFKQWSVRNAYNTYYILCLCFTQTSRVLPCAFAGCIYFPLSRFRYSPLSSWVLFAHLFVYLTSRKVTWHRMEHEQSVVSLRAPQPKEFHVKPYNNVLPVSRYYCLWSRVCSMYKYRTRASVIYV